MWPIKQNKEKEKLIHERDEALKSAKHKKWKKKSKSRNSAKFNVKLNLLADKLGVDVDGLDSSDSDINSVKARHRKEEKRIEFDGYGIKRNPPKYFSMHREGLCRHLKVDKKFLQ